MTSTRHRRPAPPLARTALDRAAHRRTDADWLAQAWIRAKVFVVDDGHVLVHRADQPRLVYVEPGEAPAGERYFLGEAADGTPYFAVSADVTAGEATRRVTLRQVGHLLPDLEASLFVTAVAVANWHARHVYSPVSGRLTKTAEAGWTRVTDDGVETLWPRTDPAIIVVVHDDGAGPDGRCLLGCNAAWPTLDGRRRFSCLAGFVEPGESAEAAVAREVAEEVGVPVAEVRYVASQAWPFPGSLMLGFHAVADPGAPIRVDPSEILEARWFTRAEVAAAIDGSSEVFALPPSASIASYLITEWLAGRT